MNFGKVRSYPYLLFIITTSSAVLSGALTHLPDCVKNMGLKLPFGLAEIGKYY
jgi:hypothetical protein